MKKHKTAKIVLLFFTFSLISHDLIAMNAQTSTGNNTNTTSQKKKPTADESLGKLIRLRWSQLGKDDLINFAKIGLAVGGFYIVLHSNHVLNPLRNYRNIRPDDMYNLPNNNNQGTQHSAAWLDQVENEQQECAICMEDFNLANRYRLTCGHNNCCGDCLRRHIRAQASEANITQIICPHNTAHNSDCNHTLTPQEMINIANGDQQILDDARQAIINGPRNRALQNVPNLRACHSCPTLFVYRGRNLIHCPGCHAVYCAYCRGDHNGNVQRCATPNENVAKRCARCGSEIIKNGGCNHMTCTQCSYHFCWTCLGPHDQNGCRYDNCGILNPPRANRNQRQNRNQPQNIAPEFQLLEELIRLMTR